MEVVVGDWGQRWPSLQVDRWEGRLTCLIRTIFVLLLFSGLVGKREKNVEDWELNLCVQYFGEVYTRIVTFLLCGFFFSLSFYL